MYSTYNHRHHNMTNMTNNNKNNITKKMKGKKNKKQNNPLNLFDFTIPMTVNIDTVIETLKGFCKQYVFQMERAPTTGYEHYQGRISTASKKRISTMLKLEQNKILNGVHWSITSNDGILKNKFSYVMDDTKRIPGTRIYKDTDIEKYIPRQYRNKLENLRPFQTDIWNSAKKFDDRTINMIYCPDGSIGKSVIASVTELFGDGIDLPPCNDAEKLIQSCCNICMAKNTRTPSPIFIDLPRAMNKDRLNGIYTAIEQIKKGKLYELRYKYRCWWIDSPTIWVFSNIEPDLTLLSMDRWKIWTVDKEYKLRKYLEISKPSGECFL